MARDDERVEQVDAILAATEIAGALESEQFRRFLDKIPIAIAVSELSARERIVYANPEFERLTGITAAKLEGRDWSALRGVGEPREGQADLGTIIAASHEDAEEFCLGAAGNPPVVDAYSHVIENDDGVHIFRLAALVELRAPQQAEREDLRRRLMEKDLQLREIQHRVKNNLQMITALIRIESRNASSQEHTAPFNRLAGRIEALHLLYQALAAEEKGDVVDLGVYLSQIASAVMQSHGVEGIRLDLKLDAYPVSVNVAMPTGLVVNELFTNALKYAFEGREGGTITLHSLVDGDGCRVIVADDGIGLPPDRGWPEPGKLGALIVQSLRENAKADVKVESTPGKGMRVTIRYARKEAAPEAG
jgi:PAS domain S-box-containing protein